MRLQYFLILTLSGAGSYPDWTIPFHSLPEAGNPCIKVSWQGNIKLDTSCDFELFFTDAQLLETLSITGTLCRYQINFLQHRFT